ncbi:MAG: nucleoside hydrolase [Erysipelotrichaceae bacterium]|nr:nucleoside hydrolase [Erysipelotrichaceae bacterium]
MKRKIILDCDPGHDDAVALMMAGIHPSIDLLGVTIVSGNQTLEKNLTNALNICQYLNIDVPVYAGSTRPLVKKPVYAEFIHGKSGLDGPTFDPLVKKPEEKFAPVYIAETLMNSEEKITLVPTGPLTNIALAMRLEPKIVDKIEEIVLMGGSVDSGNITPAAEFNIWVDAEAARIVFESGVKVVMCGLNVTRKLRCFQEIIDRMDKIGNKASTLFKEMMEFYNQTQLSSFGWVGGPLHDPLTIAYLIDNSVLKLNHCHVDVDNNNSVSYGRTNCDFPGIQGLEPTAYVAEDVDIEKFWNIIEECLKLYS